MSYQIINGDALEVLQTIPDNSINLIITSPPYNKGYWSKNRNPNNGFKTKSRRIVYGDFDDSLPPHLYEQQQKKLIQECLRVLKPNGSLFYNHKDILRDHQTIHPIFVYEFPVKQIIVWNRKNTPALDKSYFFPVTEYIFWIQKTKDARVYFNRKEAMFQTNVWDISPATNNNHPAPFPETLVNNIIQSCSQKNDMVLDPYSGSGTTGACAVKQNRNYIGIEIVPSFIEESIQRIKELI